MARDGILRLRTRRRAARPVTGIEAAPAVPAPRAGAAAAQQALPVTDGDDLALVHSWLRRLSPSVEEAEELTVAVLTRARQAGPACLEAAPRTTQLQFLTIQAVLGRRGVL